MIKGKTITGSEKPVVVLKFGGTSLADAAAIRNATKRVISERAKGKHVVVVVSAMAGETNRLLAMGLEFGQGVAVSRRREFDALVSTGEQVSAALMAMALQEQGLLARSLTAHQIKVHSDNCFQSARIRSIDSSELLNTLNSETIVVATGFQGIDHEGNVVTLGRGGSDTSAVALAVALNAESCEIFTDVEGVFTADPSVFPGGKKVEKNFFRRNA